MGRWHDCRAVTCRRCWAGHFYAVETITRLGLEKAGGLVRVGLCHYNTREEVDRFILAMAELLSIIVTHPVGAAN